MSIEPGKVYKHYKGKEYIVITCGNMEDSGNVMVVYTDYPVGANTVWIRPIDEFKEKFKPI